MKDLMQQADEIPVTLLVCLAYVTLAFLTDPIAPKDTALHQHGWLLATLVSDGEAWRLLSSAFLHGGWMHLAFNTYAMLSIGPVLERTLGSVRMAVLYLVGALGGSLCVCLVNVPFQPVLGGSGALFGMMGAVLALQIRSSSAMGATDFSGAKRTLKLIAFYLVLGLFLPFISNTAHFGGVVAGFGLTLLFFTGTWQDVRWMAIWRASFVALVAGLLLHTLQPTTRWDWLWRQAQGAADTDRANDLAIAAAMSLTGKDNVTEADIYRVRSEMIALDQLLEKWNGG